MMKRKALYTLLACASILFILYALTQNYIIDPGAEAFLSHKTGLKRELNLPAWLNAMYVHVAFACIAMAAGLLNFSNRMFEKSRRFHRVNGYVYFLSVLIVVLTSGYMAPYATAWQIKRHGVQCAEYHLAAHQHHGACANQKETDRPPPELDDPKLCLLFYEPVHPSHHFPFPPGIRNDVRHQLYH